MTYSLLKPKKRVLEAHKISKTVKILRELPSDADSRIANIHRRNEILKANKHYQLKLERDRANSALASLPENQMQNMRQMLIQHRKDLTTAMLPLTMKGGVP